MTSSPPEPPSLQSTAPIHLADWLAAIPALHPSANLKTLQLAWLGDAVWELHQRLLRCQTPGRPADLHGVVVTKVRAEAQAQALKRLQPLLRPQEVDLVRRGRNRAGRGSRHQDPGLYGLATGFETMVGWLFLNDPRRLAELLDHLEKPDPFPTAADHEPINE